jgi:hypothetical protein
MLMTHFCTYCHSLILCTQHLDLYCTNVTISWANFHQRRGCTLNNDNVDAPVASTPDTENNHTHSMTNLQGLAGRHSQQNAHVRAGTLFTVTGERFVADLSPSGLLHMLPHEPLPPLVSMESALFSFLFPYDMGWHCKPASGQGSRFDFQTDSQHRCLQTCSVLTIHSAYLLMLKSMLNCPQVLASSKRQGHVCVFKELTTVYSAKTPVFVVLLLWIS